MEPLEFLAEVLPPPGNGRYCVVELSKNKEHVYVDTLDQAQAKIDAWNKQGLDVYFALGTFGDLDRRNQCAHGSLHSSGRGLQPPKRLAR